MNIQEPTVDQVLQQFLDESATGKAASDQPRQDAISLLKGSLNAYAYLNLLRDDRSAFDEYSSFDGERKTFCQIFGPDKIAPNIRSFATTYLICQNNMNPARLERLAKITEQLCKWLVAKNFATADDMTVAIGWAGRGVKDLPRAAKAMGLLAKDCEQFGGKEAKRDKRLGTSTISRIESHRIWLQPDHGKPVGPIALSPKIIEHLDPDWEIDCSVRQIGKNWRITSIGNIYPQ